MKTSNIKLTCCLSLCEGDGISPRHEKNKEQNNVYDNRRLCRQVQKLTHLAIQELGLDGWDIINVQQKAGKTSLLLTIAPTQDSSLLYGEQVLTWLKEHQQQIRFIVANGINRKSVPALHFGLALGGNYE